MRSLLLLTIICSLVALSFQSSTPAPTPQVSYMTLSGIVHDVSPCTNTKYCGQGFTTSSKKFDCAAKGYVCHPDFENVNKQEKNLCTLGKDGTPVLNSSLTSPVTVKNADSFYTWYHDVYLNGSKSMQSIPININITLANDPTCTTSDNCDMTFTFSDTEFFPIDNQGFGNYIDNSGNNYGHNFGYTFAASMIFKYYGGEIFSFTGDDDLWIFINEKRVIDLGGCHSALDASVSLDTLGLTVGKSYTWKMYYAERHTSKSELTVTTNMALQCAYIDWCGVCGGDGQSCCNCKARNVCETAKCNVTTGACIYTPVTCTQPNNADGSTNQCFESVCDVNAGGCVTKDLSASTCTNPNNVPCAPLGVCSNTTGCVYVTPTDNNPCTTDTCTNGVMTYPSNCVNSTTDKCTLKSCDLSKGCITSYVTCPSTSGHCGINGKCNSATGGCVYETNPCDDNDPCTTDSCDADSGCQNIPISCPAGNCTVGYCDGSGVCQTKAAPNCKLCDASCVASDACHPAYCDFTTGTCIHDNPCPNNNLCVNSTCNVVSDKAQCTFTPVTCTSSDPCQPNVCSNGQCVPNLTPCDDNNLCTVDTCTNVNGTKQCSYDPKCPVSICNAETCNTTTGECSDHLLDCSDGNLCTNDACDETTGCYFTDVNCDDGVDCTLDSCNTTSGLCVHVDSCDDNNVCTNDFCNTTGNACVHTEIALNSTGNLCLLQYCDPYLGVLTTSLDCRPTDRCSCDPTVGCVCTERNTGLTPAQKGGLAGGVIAGVVIASVVGAAALVFGGKKGYDYMQAHAMQGAEIQNNPMYQEASPANENPLFENTV